MIHLFDKNAAQLSQCLPSLRFWDGEPHPVLGVESWLASWNMRESLLGVLLAQAFRKVDCYFW